MVPAHEHLRQMFYTPNAVESEMKNLKSQIRVMEKHKDEKVAAARAKITEANAKKLILASAFKCWD